MLSILTYQQKCDGSHPLSSCKDMLAAIWGKIQTSARPSEPCLVVKPKYHSYQVAGAVSASLVMDRCTYMQHSHG